MDCWKTKTRWDHPSADGCREKVADDLLKEIAAQLRQEKLSRQLTEKVSVPTDKEIRHFYEDNLDARFTVPEMVRAGTYR